MLHFHIFLVSYLLVVFQIEALSSNTSCVVHYHIVAVWQTHASKYSTVLKCLLEYVCEIILWQLLLLVKTGTL